MREFYTGNALREIIEAKAKHVAAKLTVISIDDLIEKPAIEQAPSNLAIAARYVFSPKIFEVQKFHLLGKINFRDFP